MIRKLFLGAGMACACTSFTAEAASVKISQQGVVLKGELPAITGEVGETVIVSAPDSAEFYNGSYEFFKGWSDGVREKFRKYTITGKNDSLTAIYSLPGKVVYTIYDAESRTVLKVDTLDYSEMYYYAVTSLKEYAGTISIPGYEFVEGSEQVVDQSSEQGYPVTEYRTAYFKKSAVSEKYSVKVNQKGVIINGELPTLYGKIGETIEISAPDSVEFNDGYHEYFVGWSDGVRENKRKYTITGERIAFTAIYSLPGKVIYTVYDADNKQVILKTDTLDYSEMYYYATSTTKEFAGTISIPNYTFVEGSENLVKQPVEQVGYPVTEYRTAYFKKTGATEKAIVKVAQFGVVAKNDLPSIFGEVGETVIVSAPDSIEFYDGKYEFFKGWSDGVRENKRKYTITGENDSLTAIYALPGKVVYTVYDADNKNTVLKVDTLDYSEMFYYAESSKKEYAGTIELPGYEFVEGSEQVKEQPAGQIGYPVTEYRTAYFKKTAAVDAIVKVSQFGVTVQGVLPSISGVVGETIEVSAPDSMEFYNGQYEYFKGWSDGVRENKRKYTITGKNDSLTAIYSLPGKVIYTIYDADNKKVVLKTDTLDYSEMYYYEVSTLNQYAGTISIPNYSFVEGSERLIDQPVEQVGYPVTEYRTAYFKKTGTTENAIVKVSQFGVAVKGDLPNLSGQIGETINVSAPDSIEFNNGAYEFFMGWSDGVRENKRKYTITGKNDSLTAIYAFPGKVIYTIYDDDNEDLLKVDTLDYSEMYYYAVSNKKEYAGTISVPGYNFVEGSEKVVKQETSQIGYPVTEYRVASFKKLETAQMAEVKIGTSGVTVSGTLPAVAGEVGQTVTITAPDSIEFYNGLHEFFKGWSDGVRELTREYTITGKNDSLTAIYSLPGTLYVTIYDDENEDKVLYRDTMDYSEMFYYETVNLAEYTGTIKLPGYEFVANSEKLVQIPTEEIGYPVHEYRTANFKKIKDANDDYVLMKYACDDKVIAVDSISRTEYNDNGGKIMVLPLSDYKFNAVNMDLSGNELVLNFTYEPGFEAANSIIVSPEDYVSAKVENVANDADLLVSVYTINGVLIRKSVKRSEALDGLSKGTYVVGNKVVRIMQ